MFSTALIIFREAFEIVLIVGIVLAATRGLKGRRNWIGLGFFGGIAGAAAVAMFAGKISSAAGGMGQEFFNAFILFAAAAMIGWTVLWMKQHAREMKSTFKKMGSDIARGKAPFYSLSVIIALAMLREGSEIVLFSYGALASGQSLADVLLGCLIGLSSGTALGVLVYKGLVQLSIRHFMMVTSWLLVLLVAGLVSQGIGFLTAAGYFTSFSRTVWDSSWLLSDSGMIGQSLKILIGYTSRPTQIQVIAYIATVAGLLLSLRKIDAEHQKVPGTTS